MKKTVIPFIAVAVCIAAVLFFPVSKTWSVSGNGSVLNGEKERVGGCTMAVEVTERKSLVMRYKMNFSFTLDGVPRYASEEVRFPAAVSVTEHGDCMISQFYYNEETNSMKHCDLFYRGDHSYTEIFWKDNYYTLGTE